MSMLQSEKLPARRHGVGCRYSYLLAQAKARDILYLHLACLDMESN